MPAAQTISALASLLNSLIAMSVLGLVSVGGWYAYDKLNDSQKLTQVQEELSLVSEELDQTTRALGESRQKVDQLETSMHLLKVDHRVAELTVLDQITDGPERERLTLVEFVEIDDQGQAVEAPRQFKLLGTKAYVDYWVVKFDEKYVEQAALNRSTSICLFRRIFGEYQQPADGYSLDSIGSRPNVYARTASVSDFEHNIWQDFWSIANDSDLAAQKGIRAAHGDAVYTNLRKGRTYRLELRASGGLTIRPLKTRREEMPAV